MFESSRVSRPFWLLVGVLLATVAVYLLSQALSVAGATSTVLIDSVHFDGYALNDADEAVRLVNASDGTLALDGWRLSDGSTAVALPAGIVLAPGAGLWLAGDGDAFRAQFGHDADFVLAPWPGFANAGDEVALIDAAGATVDALVYAGGNTLQTGWSGAAVEPYRVSGVFGVEGQILYRRRDQVSGAPAADSDTAGDWAQSPHDVIDGRKVRYPGWSGERFFRPPVITATAALTIAIAPDNAYDALVQAIRAADTSIRLASLTLENMPMAGELADAARRGVAVTALLEGGPPGGITDQERAACQIIESAGGACWFMIADDAQRIHDRYRFMHAKYLIIDDTLAVIGSENFSPDSLPDDDKGDGTWGRRGVFLLTDAPAVAAHLAAVFADDLDAAHADLTRWTAADPLYGAPPPGFVPDMTSGGITYTVRFPAPAVFYNDYTFEIIQAPENALRDRDSLLGLVGRAGAGDTLLVQQLSERPYWGATTSNPAADPNPRLESYIAAARRGADVRLLLDSFFDDPDSPVSNVATCAYVNEIARAEGLPLHCELANPTGLGIHNKMVLARIGGRGYVHIGSINGTELSNKGNREMALQVQSDAAYAYLTDLFSHDAPRWLFAPLVLGGFSGAVDRVLISEVAYDTPGLDEAEYVEIANPTGVPVDLSGYAIGDAVFYDDFEDMLHFPPGLVLPAHDALVVTLSAVAFREAFNTEPDLEIINSDPAVPDMLNDPFWGDPEALFQLGNGGDEVVLIRWDGLVDVVTYGAGFHSAVVGCPLLVPPARVLERVPYWADSDVCPVDFRAWPLPSPGKLPP